MRLRSAILCVLLLAAPAYAQVDKPTEIVVPNAPGGKAVVVSRAQLRAAPGTKTARLPHPVRAALDAKEQVLVPAAFDWTTKDGKQVNLPMMGNDRLGDCYYVAPCKLHIMYFWMLGKGQLTFDQAKLEKRYLQLSGGDNGLDDSRVFPEMKGGLIGPNGPHKSLEQLIIPSTDKKALDLVNYAFGPMMLTFDVYENFQQGVAPNKLLTGNGGRNVGGHAVPISGKTAEGYRVGETWGIQPGFRAADSWVAGVEPEFIASFSLEWFDGKGYAPNGMHFTVLAPLWNSMGGHVSLVSPFPPPVDPTPTPIPVPNPVPPAPVPTAGYTLTYTYTSDGRLVGPPVVNAQPSPAPAAVSKEEIRGIIDAKFKGAFPGIAKIGDANLNQLIEEIAEALWNWFTHRNDATAPKKASRATDQPPRGGGPLRIDGTSHRRVFRGSNVLSMRPN